MFSQYSCYGYYTAKNEISTFHFEVPLITVQKWNSNRILDYTDMLCNNIIRLPVDIKANGKRLCSQFIQLTC